ncbi:MAG TPA: hypothetical protein VN328_02915, partial [Thermodesulfovibrionales bacterium]|nr:hypothetical protein [Thermodesulfovibrionales bacterium]
NEKAEIRDIARNGVSAGKDLEKILHFFEKYSVIEESLRIARRLVSEAKGELSVFPACPEKEALLMMSDYALSRDR